MKKLFFFKSSSGNGIDHKQLHKQNAIDHKQLHKQKDDHFQQIPKGFIKSQSDEVSDAAAALRRSRSLSSAAFLIDGTNATRSSQHRLRNHSSR